MTNFQNKNRHSIRLQKYDYSVPGLYFVTICIKHREHNFGYVKNGKMVLFPIGEIAMQCWLEIPKHYPDTVLDEFMIMPNHLHGVIEILERNVGAQYLVPDLIPDPVAQYFVPDDGTMQSQAQRFMPEFTDMQIGVQDIEPLPGTRENKFQHIIPGSIGAIVRGFKIGVTKWCRNNNHEYFGWQRNFYEHIIRNERELDNVRNYIVDNPEKWEQDIENLQFMKQLLEKERDFRAQKYYDQMFLK